MIDSLSYSLLQEIIRRESRSLLQYVAEAVPWTKAGERETWSKLQKLIEEQQQALNGLVRWLTRQRLLPPYLGSYPSEFTDVNFISLEHLLPMLRESERRCVNHLERDLALLHESEARKQVQAFLEMKERHLKALETLNTPTPAAVS
jgi:hypothetical protein